jgi:hypothetical protein
MDEASNNREVVNLKGIYYPGSRFEPESGGDSKRNPSPSH